MLFLILIDGLNFDIFNELMKEDKLPNIKFYLLNNLNGVMGKMLTTFPSATAPSMPELFTGKYCYKLKVSPKKIHAFNRIKNEMLRYEFLSKAWKNEQNDIMDLVDKFRGPVLSFFKGKFQKVRTHIYNEFLYNIDAITDFTGLDFINYDEKIINDLIKILEKKHRNYQMVFLSLVTADLNGHFHGVNDPRYRASIIQIDNYLGSLFRKLIDIRDEDGVSLFEKSHFIIFGDHGMSEGGKYIDLTSLFKGLNINSADLSRTSALLRNKLLYDWAEDFDILIVPGGSNIAELYVRAYRNLTPSPWSFFPSIDNLLNYYNKNNLKINLISSLQAINNIDIIAVQKSPNIIYIFSPYFNFAKVYVKRSEGELKICYQWIPTILNGKTDPLNYTESLKTKELICNNLQLNEANYEDEEFDNYFHGIDEWLEVSFDSFYPLAPFFLWKAFTDSETKSDIILTAKRGYNFMKWNKGDHGALSRDSIFTAVVIASKRINRDCELKYFRNVDLFPIMCRFMDIPPQYYQNEDIDGKLPDNLF